MRYYKIIYNGYVQRIGIGNGGVEISKDEFEYLTNLIHNKPIAESGYGYKLKEDLTWELCEVPIVEITEEYQEKQGGELG